MNPDELSVEVSNVKPQERLISFIVKEIIGVGICSPAAFSRINLEPVLRGVLTVYREDPNDNQPT